MRARPLYTESWEQQQVIKWARLAAIQYPALRYLHNSLSGFKLSTMQASIAKSEGMVAGIPDLFLPIPKKDSEGVIHYCGLYIEMKRPATQKRARGVLSEAQKECIAFLNEQGYKAVVCYGAIEAISEIKNYLGI